MYCPSIVIAAAVDKGPLVVNLSVFRLSFLNPIPKIRELLFLQVWPTTIAHSSSKLSRREFRIHMTRLLPLLLLNSVYGWM